MLLGDTIAANASGPGRSPRAIIRLSGPDTAPALMQLLDPLPAARGAHTAILAFDGREMPVQVLRFVAPHSYTGEDSAEILLPGNPHLVERILARLLAVGGVRQAEPGEFSARAFINGRMPLDALEGVAAVISAAGADQLASARRILNGAAGAQYRDWSDRASTLLALVEAGIDFSDQEDVTAISPRDLHDRAATLAGEITARLCARAGRERVSPVPLVALVGPPNAGKSTLFNALLGRTRAVVSPLAGTTRDALIEPLELSQPDSGALSILLADLAGLDESPTTPTESAAQQQARQTLSNADVILLCSDSGCWSGPEAIAPNARIIRVHTKADRPGAGIAAAECIPVCALDGWNLAALRRAVFDAAWDAGPGMARDLLPRHRLALVAAHEVLDRLAQSLTPHIAGSTLPSPELIAGSLRLAVDHLGQLTGRIPPDEIIGRIFASFCIGK